MSRSELRRAEQHWLSRQLHDDLGPSLCAAGLQLSLMRTEAGEMSAECTTALDAVQAILDNTVDRVRLLSYAVCPANAAKCGLRDMVPMLARAFRVEVPEFDSAPAVMGAGAIELAEQLLDCLLLMSSGEARPNARVILLADSVVLEAQGRLGETLTPIAARNLKYWRTTLRERSRLARTSFAWTFGATQE